MGKKIRNLLTNAKTKMILIEILNINLLNKSTATISYINVLALIRKETHHKTIKKFG